MRILIIGATSAMAEAVARQYAQVANTKKDTELSFCLVARNESRLTMIAEDLKVRGASSVTTKVMDVKDTQMHQSMVEEIFEAGPVNLVLIAHGVLPDQTASESDVDKALDEINVNATSVISLLLRIANYMSTQETGTLAVITSVAGDRGRKSNYLYGASKGMLSIFLEGLKARLFAKGVQVLDIRPGFVDTPMTADLEKGGPLWAKPEKIAADIIKAVRKKKAVIYTPFFWRYIMLIIKYIPGFIFKRLNF